MASGNRVEELESRVKELEATVDGLTDELVECKVRIRELENAVDAAGGLDAIEGLADQQSQPQDAQQQTDPQQESSEPADETQPAEPADTTKTEAVDGDDNAESETSDIIIA